MAAKEIASVFASKDGSEFENTDIGFMGDVVGKCPLCSSNVVRTKFGYGCSAYRDGCKFSFGFEICGAVISATQARKLIATGSTDIIDGFYSKRTGKNFSARLKLDGGKAVFDFN